MTPRRFRDLVLAHYRAHGRHSLPWRSTSDPYRILVSEIMLQQTQVDRVIPYYRAWLKRFPTVRALARAPLADVLVGWQGLGYNRRAKMLHEAARVIVSTHRGKVPDTVEGLESLPGIGPYTARAVAAFAHSLDVVLVETNVRTAVIHHFFNDKEGITDAQIAEIIAKALPQGEAREWYAALMDYGAHLKRSGIRTNARVKGYARQKSFAGSDREARGAILRALAQEAKGRPALLALLGPGRREQLASQLEKLVAEGFVERSGRAYRLAQ
jgi:A/G-specific adenine glycosylase